mmetsp:Transcript_3046/g.9051  ORF Transcript_3046/g.9051 Transcript_3046/m.9051 type:complete len:227 (+) Transcript_3046:621-1301(+)
MRRDRRPGLGDGRLQVRPVDHRRGGRVPGSRGGGDHADHLAAAAAHQGHPLFLGRHRAGNRNRVCNCATGRLRDANSRRPWLHQGLLSHPGLARRSVQGPAAVAERPRDLPHLPASVRDDGSHWPGRVPHDLATGWPDHQQETEPSCGGACARRREHHHRYFGGDGRLRNDRPVHDQCQVRRSHAHQHGFCRSVSVGHHPRRLPSHQPCPGCISRWRHVHGRHRYL